MDYKGSSSPVSEAKTVCISMCANHKLFDSKQKAWVDIYDYHGESEASMLDATNSKQKESRAILDMIKVNILENENILKVFHNYKFDAHGLENLNVKVKGPIADTMIMARLEST